MRMKSFRDRSPILVGVVSLLVLGLVIALTYITGTMGLLKHRYTMSGVFTDVGGLRTGNDVLVAGVRVGEVTKIEPDFRAGHVLITWKVNDGIDLGPQTRAEIRMANILGGRYLRLTGPVAKPYMQDVSENRRRIPVDRTQIPTTVNEALQAGTETLKGIDTKTLSKVLDQLGDISDEDRGHLRSSLSNLTDIADALDGDDVKIGDLLDSAATILDTVHQKDAQLRQLVDDATTLIAALRKRRTQLTLLLGSGSKAVKSADDLINGQQQGLIDIIDDLNGTTNAIDPQVDDLNKALAWAGPSLSAFVAVGDTGNYIDTIFTQMGQLSPTDLAKLGAMMKEARKK